MSVERSVESLVHVGSKRKAGEIDEPTSKKQKLIFGSSNENRAIIPEIPQECWEIIISYIQLDTAISAFLVSKSWQNAYCRLLYQKLSRALGIPLSKARFVPSRVKRRFSNLDLFVLLERLMAANDQKDFATLLTLSIQLQALSSMIANLSLNAAPEFKYGQSTIMSLRASYCQSVVYTHMSPEKAYLYSIGDETMCCISRSYSYHWFGEKGRYVEVAVTLLEDGKSGDEFMFWGSTHCVIKLNELDSDVSKEMSKWDTSNEYMNKKNEHFWRDEDMQVILDWLGIPEEIDLKMFKCLLKFPFDGTRWMYAGYSSDTYNEREWNERLKKDMDRMTNVFLSSKQGWTTEIELVANRMKSNLLLKKEKTILLNNVKTVNFTSENARYEFLEILQSAAMTLQRSKHIERDSEDVIELLVYHKGTCAVRIALDRSPDENKSSLNLKMPAYHPYSLSNSHIDFNHYACKMIYLLGLKYVTPVDLKEALAKMAPTL